MKNGYLFLHGKDSGPRAPVCAMSNLVNSFSNIGELVDFAAYSWGYKQIFTQPFDEAVIAEVDAAIERLTNAGADYIHIVGHSIGCVVALYYATQRSNFTSIVLLAPAHNTHTEKMQLITEWSRKKATALLATPNYNRSQIEQFVDNSANDIKVVDSTALNYMSYMDPQGNTNMVLNAEKIPRSLNILLIAGRNDVTQISVVSRIFFKIKRTSLSKFIITDDTHVSVSGTNSFDAIKNWTRSIV